MDAHQNDPRAIMSTPLIGKDGKNRQIFYEKPTVTKKDALKMELKNFVENLSLEMKHRL